MRIYKIIDAIATIKVNLKCIVKILNIKAFNKQLTSKNFIPTLGS